MMMIHNINGKRVFGLICVIVDWRNLFENTFILLSIFSIFQKEKQPTKLISDIKKKNSSTVRDWLCDEPEIFHKFQTK